MTVTELVDTARRPAAVEATIAVVRELAADVRATERVDTRELWTRELVGARKVLARLVSARYMALDVHGARYSVVDRWDHNAPIEPPRPRRVARDLAAEQNALNAAELLDELRAELVALDPPLGRDWSPIARTY